MKLGGKFWLAVTITVIVLFLYAVTITRDFIVSFGG